MPKKLSTKLTDDTDIRIAVAWKTFREKLSEYLDNVDSACVDLSFESSLDAHTHYKFDSDELVYVTDVVVSPSGTVRFNVPYGSRNKSFHYSEAELIDVDQGGKTKTLQAVIQRVFKDSFEGIPEASTILNFERNYLRKEPELGEVLNNVDDFLEQYKLNNERKDKYSKLPHYGLF